VRGRHERCCAPTSARDLCLYGVNSEPIAEASKAKGDDLVFFYAPTAEGPVEQVRKLTKLESSTGKPQMLLLDIPDSGGYYVSPADTVTADTVDGFIAAYKAKGLERKQLG